ncbi:MAG: hypothetical protein R3B95_07730 [Nitrospirales bacterium]|nr:hypothetical protein [Nitrospirales bacterium]
MPALADQIDQNHQEHATLFAAFQASLVGFKAAMGELQRGLVMNVNAPVRKKGLFRPSSRPNNTPSNASGGMPRHSHLKSVSTNSISI